MTNPRPRNIANDILDAVETATSKWTRQKKSEERHPGNIRYRASRMTREPRTTQKEAAWSILEAAYMAASGNGRLPALARQIFYQARPKIMAMTDDKELQYGYFSQTLLPDYIEENGVDWNVVYGAADISKSRTPTGASAVGLSRSRIIWERSMSRTSFPLTLPARASMSSVRPGTSAPSCSAKRRGSARCSRR
jgi:hypothetical protein